MHCIENVSANHVDAETVLFFSPFVHKYPYIETVFYYYLRNFSASSLCDRRFKTIFWLLCYSVILLFSVVSIFAGNDGGERRSKIAIYSCKLRVHIQNVNNKETSESWLELSSKKKWGKKPRISREKKW